MKWFDKFLSLIGLQRKVKIKTPKEIKQEMCEHEWYANRPDSYRLRFSNTIVYCPKYDKERIVEWETRDLLIEQRKIKEEYNKNIEDEFDNKFKNLK